MKVKLLDITPDAERKIAEAAGICYDSNVTKHSQLVKRLKVDGHLATMRFATATFQISEFSRTCSMQMLRHAFLDVLQRSQRYVNEFNFEYVTPPSIASNEQANREYHYIMRECQLAYGRMLDWGIPKEDARYVLPESVHTKMNIIGNFQAWIDFLYGNAGRLQKKAQWEIRGIATEIERQLSIQAPNVFNRNTEW